MTCVLVKVGILEMSPFLGYGRGSLETFCIPLDYAKLVWKVNLISIDIMVRGMIFYWERGS